MLKRPLNEFVPFPGLHEFKQLAMACLLLVYCVELCAMSCPYSGTGMRITLSDDSLESGGNYLACYEGDGHFHSFFVPQTNWANENPDPLPDFYFNTHSSSLNLYLSNDIETFFLPVTLSEYSEIVVRKTDSASPDRFFLYFLWPVTTMTYEVVSGGYCECYANSSEVLECFFEPEQDIIRLKTEVPLYMPAKAGKPDENPPGVSGDDGYPPSYLLILQSRLQKKEPPSEKKSLPMPGWFLSQSYQRAGVWLDDTLSDIGTRVSGWYKGAVTRQNRFIEVYMYGQDDNQEDDETPRSKPPQQSRPDEESQPDQNKTDSGQRLKKAGNPLGKPLNRFSPEEKKRLQQAFQQSRYPTANKLNQLATGLNTQTKRVRIWFKNQRGKWKRDRARSELRQIAETVKKPLLSPYLGVTPSFCSGASNYQAPVWGEADSTNQLMMPPPCDAANQDKPQSDSSLSGQEFCPPGLPTFAQASPQGIPAMLPKPTSRLEPASDDAETPRLKPRQLSSPGQKSPSVGKGEQSATKQTRTGLTPVQLQELERVFIENAYPPDYRKQELASHLCLSVQVVTNWFQNRRRKWRDKNPGQAHLMGGAIAAMAGSPLLTPYPYVMQSGGSGYQSPGWGWAGTSAQSSIPPGHYMPPQPAPQALNPTQYSGFGQVPGIYPPPQSHPPYPPHVYAHAQPPPMPVPSLVPPIPGQAQYSNEATATGSAVGGGAYDFSQTSYGLSSYPAPQPAPENFPVPDLSSGNQEEEQDLYGRSMRRF